MANTNFNYSGETVFVGIDVHKLTYMVTAVCGGVIVKSWRMTANALDLVNQLNKFFGSAGKIVTCYEAGFTGFDLHRVLTSHGIENLVVDAASIEVAANETKKTDKRDSKRMAELLSVGRIKGIFVPTLEDDMLRQRTRLRAQMVTHKTRVAQQIKARLHYFGYLMGEKSPVVRETFLQKIEEQKDVFPKEVFAVFEFQIRHWRFLNEQVEMLNRELKSDVRHLTDLYKSVPGIGDLSAHILAYELGDFSRFSNEQSLFQYTGLTPSEHSSGEKIQKGGIDRKGPKRLRYLLVEAAWVAVAKDPALKAVFERIKVKRGSKVAIAAVARRLAGRIRACAKNNCAYRNEMGMMAMSA